MGKQGPCYHCGVTSTPLWRNGPPDKPILCNACGSRWRTKGTLVNYTPLHARSEPNEFEDHRVSRVKSISIKNKEEKFLKRKENYESMVGNSTSGIIGGSGGGGGGHHHHHHHHQGFCKGLYEDTSNRSSSGSAISNSDSCLQLGSADASDLTGPAQSSAVRDTTVPSRKRTCVTRSKQLSVEKLTRDLYTILHEQQSYFSGSSEEDLIFESNNPMVSVEIGHGSVLIRHPNSVTREEESEASSLSFDTKNEAYSQLITFPVYSNVNKGGNFLSRGSEKTKNPMDQDRDNRGDEEKLPILVNRNSPLCYIELKDIINFEEFTSQMTNEEQQQLLKYLPPVDSVQYPDSLKSMFDSPQFTENVLSFQELLAEGNFDLSAPAKTEGFRTLKKLALCNLTKSKWVEQYNRLQDTKRENDHRPGGLVNVKRSQDTQFHPVPGLKNTENAFMKASNEHNEIIDNEGVGFSPRSLFALSPDNNHLALDYLQYAHESSDRDLLLDVPSHTSFPQAELLPASSFAAASSS